MKCPNGHEYQNGRYCALCGAKLEKPRLLKGPYTVMAYDRKPTCPNCGSSLEPFTQKYCSGCGHEIEWDTGGMR